MRINNFLNFYKLGFFVQIAHQLQIFHLQVYGKMFGAFFWWNDKFK